jgi:hypothetical protein
MYAQVERPKENKSRAVANSIAQRKSCGKQGFGFVDNRTEVVSQCLLQEKIATQTKKKPKLREGARTLELRNVTTIFSKIVKGLTGSDAVLGGGAAVNALGGKRTVNDLDFRLIPTQKIFPNMIESINEELKDEFKNEIEDEEEFLIEFEYKDERSKTTIIGNIGKIEVSLTAQPEHYEQHGLLGGFGIKTLDQSSLIMEKIIGLNHRVNEDIKEAQDLYDIGTLYYLQKENIDMEYVNAEIENRNEDAQGLAQLVEEISEKNNPKEYVLNILDPIFGSEAKKHVKKVWNGLQMVFDELE